MANKVDSNKLDLAKSLYMRYTPINQIVAESGILRATVLYHIPKWRAERELLKSEVLDALTDSKKELISTIAKNGLEVLANSMAELVKAKKGLTPREMGGIAAIVDSLDKISKLDDGQATDIIAEVRPASIVEIRKLLKKDPFMEIEDACITDNSISGSDNVNTPSDGTDSGTP